jgi:hypothetical protein
MGQVLFEICFFLGIVSQLEATTASGACYSCILYSSLTIANPLLLFNNSLHQVFPGQITGVVSVL